MAKINLRGKKGNFRAPANAKRKPGGKPGTGPVKAAGRKATTKKNANNAKKRGPKSRRSGRR